MGFKFKKLIVMVMTVLLLFSSSMNFAEVTNNKQDEVMFKLMNGINSFKDWEESSTPILREKV